MRELWGWMTDAGNLKLELEVQRFAGREGGI
jgi:hypothetical protein